MKDLCSLGDEDYCKEGGGIREVLEVMEMDMLL